MTDAYTHFSDVSKSWAVCPGDSVTPQSRRDSHFFPHRLFLFPGAVTDVCTHFSRHKCGFPHTFLKSGQFVPVTPRRVAGLLHFTDSDDDNDIDGDDT